MMPRSRMAFGDKVMKLARKITRIVRIPRGQTMAEYALVLATIIVMSTALYKESGQIVNSILGKVLPLFAG
jgi:hypothetical protein